MSAGAVRIELASPEELHRRFGDGAPDPAGRLDYMAALRIRTVSCVQTEQALRQGGVERFCIEPGRILVHPASEAMNVSISSPHE